MHAREKEPKVSSSAYPATIFRLCTDTIIKPDGSIVVLEIGSFPESGFTGHDRHQPPLTKRQEAIRDLQAYADKHQLPVYFIGEKELLDDLYNPLAAEEAGLYWNGMNKPENYFKCGSQQQIDDLITEINSLPAKQFNQYDLTTHKCIVISLAHLRVGMSGVLFPHTSEDILERLRNVEGVVLVDDKYSDIYREIYDSKVVTSELLPSEFSPNTLIVPRMYEDGLARKIIEHFYPAKKILVKPSHSTRGHGIFILNLEDEAALDEKLQDFLLPENVKRNKAIALSRMNLNSIKYPEHLWLENDETIEPTLILQEFISSAPVVADGKPYQAVTRFVFSCIHHNGKNTFLFHGRPYHKLASVPIGSDNSLAASISKVHEESGPEPVIMDDADLLVLLEKQLESCFDGLLSKALSYNNRKVISQAFFARDNIGLQAYAMTSTMKTFPVTDAALDSIEKLLSLAPHYRAAFLDLAIWQLRFSANDCHSRMHQLVANEVKNNLTNALQVFNFNGKKIAGVIPTMVSQAVMPQLEQLWEDAEPASRLKLFLALACHQDFTRSDGKAHYSAAPELCRNMLEKISQLLWSGHADTAVKISVWCYDTLRHEDFERYMKSELPTEDCLLDEPFISDLSKLMLNYCNHPKANVVATSYFKTNLMFMALDQFPEWKLHVVPRENSLPYALDYAETITSAFKAGVGVDLIDKSRGLHIFSALFCLLRDNFKGSLQLKDARTIKIFCLIRWMSLVKCFEIVTDDADDDRWIKTCNPFDYFDRYYFSHPQQVTNAAWSLALNAMADTTNPDIDFSLSQGARFITEFLSQNTLLPSDPERNIENYARVMAFLANHCAEDPKDFRVTTFKQIMDLLQTALRQQAPASISPHAPYFVSARESGVSPAVDQHLQAGLYK